MITAVPWCADHLLTTERFLLLLFQKQSRLAFPSFLNRVAPKVYEEIRSETNRNNNLPIRDALIGSTEQDSVAVDDADDGDLTEEERLLYHLLLATASSTTPLYQMTRPDPNGAYYLEPVPQQQQQMNSKDRWRQFQALLQQPTVPKSQGAAILQAIRHHRRRPPRSNVEPRFNNKAKKLELVALEPLLLLPLTTQNPNVMNGNCTRMSTVEERVRARAAAAAQLEQQQQHNRQVSSQSSSTNFTDRVWLVRVADGLWSHARRVQAASRRFQPHSTTTTTTTSCILTLGETVTALRTALSQRGAASAGALSKRQVVQALQQLANEVPELLVWWNQDKNNNTSAEALLRVHTSVDYASIRAQLLLGVPHQDHPNDNHTTSKTKRTVSGGRSILATRTNRVNSLLHPTTRTGSRTVVTAGTLTNAPPFKKRRTDRLEPLRVQPKLREVADTVETMKLSSTVTAKSASGSSAVTSGSAAAVNTTTTASTTSSHTNSAEDCLPSSGTTAATQESPGTVSGNRAKQGKNQCRIA